MRRPAPGASKAKAAFISWCAATLPEACRDRSVRRAVMRAGSRDSCLFAGLLSFGVETLVVLVGEGDVYAVADEAHGVGDEVGLSVGG